MADVLDIDNAEEFEVDEEGDRKFGFNILYLCCMQLVVFCIIEKLLTAFVLIILQYSYLRKMMYYVYAVCSCNRAYL